VTTTRLTESPSNSQPFLLYQQDFFTDSYLDFSDPLWASSSIDNQHLLPDPSVSAPELESIDWSCAPLPSESLEFDFNTLPQPSCTDFDLGQLLTPAGSASPSTPVELSDADNNSAMGAFPMSAMGGTISVTSMNLHSQHTSPSLVPGLALKPHRQASPTSSNDQDLVIKRHRNNIAAKKYRQKKVDRIKELEDEVDEVKKERDELRIRLARQEAETAALREMLAGKLGRPME